jgi:hypothetical protein
VSSSYGRLRITAGQRAPSKAVFGGRMAMAVAGAVGALVVFGLALLLSRVVVPKSREAAEA